MMHSYASWGSSSGNVIYVLSTSLQQLAAICCLSERTTWIAVLCWKSRHAWLHSVVQALPVEYLKQGEAETVVPIWLKALGGAPSDYLECMNCNGGNRGHRHMQGKGGRVF